jgi:hypothetical protein
MKHGADDADGGEPAREDADDFGAAAQFLVQAFLVSTPARSSHWHSLRDVIRSRRAWWCGDLDSVIVPAVRS